MQPSAPISLMILVPSALCLSAAMPSDLIDAVEKRDTPGIVALLQDEVLVNARDAAGRTALTRAAALGDSGIVEKLLDAGADPTLDGETGLAPIAAAADSGDRRAVELLIQALDDPLAVKAALLIAVGKGHVALARALLRTGEIPPTGRNLSAAVHLASSQGMAAMLELLLDFGGDPNGELESGESSLGAAALTGRVEALRILLARGAEPNRAGAADRRSAAAHGSPERTIRMRSRSNRLRGRCRRC